MPMVKSRWKLDRLILLMACTAEVWHLVSQFISADMVPLSIYLYITLTIVWMLSLRREILDLLVRRKLMAGGVMLILLFVVRFLRWNVARPMSFAARLCWYLYYIPIILLPVLSVDLSLDIGREENESNARYILPLWAGGIALAAIALTNDLHGMMLHIWYDGGMEYSAHGPVYNVIVVWHIALIFTTFFILLYRCRVLMAREKWYIPVLVEMFGFFLWGFYYANSGSSPRIHGISLYNFQEVHLLVFLGLWESCILTGLIPSRSLVKEREWIRDGILKTVDREFSELRTIFGRLWRESDSAFGEDLARMGCLGAYIKRRANLELISDETGYLSTRELALAVKESLAYYELAGMTTGYEETGNVTVPSSAILSAYEVFKEIVGQTGYIACYVRVQALQTKESVGFKMLMEIDAEEKDTCGGRAAAEMISTAISAEGVSLSMREQDDSCLWELSAVYPVKRKRLKVFDWMRKGRKTHGLSGLVRFLSMEQEALYAKIRIHDSLGRCLLMTERYLSVEDQVSKDALFSEWSRAIALLESRNAPADGAEEGREHASRGTFYEPKTADRAVCFRQAEALGITVKLDGKLPENRDLLQIIDTAITVHITNILKHTTGKTAWIRSEWSKEEENKEPVEIYVLTLTNDGESLGGEKYESGGLKNLRRQTEGYGGRMEVVWEPEFCMRLIFREDKE